MNVALKKSSQTGDVQDYFYVTRLYKKLLKEFDNTLYEHSIRVSQYAYNLAILSHLTDEECIEIAIGGLLHDIGKMEISPYILNKAEKLTADEWDMVKKHPETGVKMLTPFRNTFTQTIFDMILYHHSRLDGNGYPSNVPVSNLTIAVRILTISDSYDAMTYNRSYSKAISQEEAINELILNSNSQFDQELVKIFVQFLNSKSRLVTLPVILA